ncbi:acyltransferase family protein [Leucobacter triazinivorans]|uniref:Acyltransferase n=1 Tax=Leucobacter triazinivorans TaxID=1784719 RepID=A0A4P6KHW8_9MICO|nr:acyltransferase [Leucobacter triazinivorans]QBE49962.1 acyltransferase [Leucobacter triazinivorans]
MPSEVTRSPRRTVRSIQFLRALAALGVVYYHAVDAGGVFALPSTGAWGVDVFFVISGFIIGTVTVQNSAHFFRRRVFRVVPLYWIATLAWAAAVLLVPWREGSTEVDLPGLLKSFFFIPYQMPLREGPILQLGWTLNYEMFFYLVVAVMLVLLRTARPALWGAVLLLGALVVSGFIWPASEPSLAFYQSTLLLEFLSGVLLSFVYRRFGQAGRQSAGAAVRAIGSGAGAAAALAALVVLVLQDLGVIPRLGELRAVYYGLPAVVLVAAALWLEPLIRDGRLTRALLAIGDASYAMYLFHPFVTVALSQVILGGVIATAGVPLRIVLLIMTLAAVILSSIAIDRWVDRPIQRGLKRGFLPQRRRDEPIGRRDYESSSSSM